MNSSTIRLYADDCLKYKEIHAQHDRIPPSRPRCVADLGASVADEFSSTEMSTTTNHTEVTSNHRPVHSQHPQGGRAPTSVKKRAYKTLVRPILEYAGTVWDPHAQADIIITSWKWCEIHRLQRLWPHQ